MIRSLVGVFLLGSVAFGQAPPAPPKVTPSVSVKVPDGPLVAGSLVKIDASASVGSLNWTLISLDDNSALDVHEDGQHATFAYPVPGTYTLLVEADTVDASGKIIRDQKRIPITLVSPSPTPGPVPAPSPDPTPTPNPPPPGPTKGAYLIVVADANDPTLAAVLSGPTLAGFESAQRGKVFSPSVKEDAAQITAKGYDKAMAAKGLTAPCVLLLDFATGRVLNAFALPTTDAALAAALAKPTFH